MPTFSELTLTFSADFVAEDSMRMRWDDNDTIVTTIFTWKASRSTANEVTVGTPTANAGETAAVNFEVAFLLDFTTGFVITRTVNELLIQSETEGLDFVGMTEGVDNTGSVTAAFANYIPIPVVTDVDLALVRSPHYVNIPFRYDSTIKSEIALYLWSGDFNTQPSEATHSLTKIRPTIDFSEFNVDLSDIISDELNIVPVIDLTNTPKLVNGNCVTWIKYIAAYIDPDVQTAAVRGTFAAVNGYGYYSEGVNPTTPTNKILTNSLRRKVSRTGFIVLPFINDGTFTNINIQSNNAELYSDLVPANTFVSEDFVQYVTLNVSQILEDTSVTITLGATKVVYEIVDECRFTPIQIMFRNKYGVFDSLTMFRKREDTINVESEIFVNNYISGGTYNTTKHQYQDINYQGKEKVKLNSGYIPEGENVLYKELLLSGLVYFYEGGDIVPVNVKTKSLNFKNRVNDRTVKYAIDFEYAYNLIQNV